MSLCIAGPGMTLAGGGNAAGGLHGTGDIRAPSSAAPRTGHPSTGRPGAAPAPKRHVHLSACTCKEYTQEVYEDGRGQEGHDEKPQIQT